MPGRPNRPRPGRSRTSATLSSSNCTPACWQWRRAIRRAWSCRPMPRQIQPPMAAASSIRATCSSSITMLDHRQYLNALGFRVVPAYIDIPEAGSIFTGGIGLLVGRFRILSQALLDQLDHRLLQALGMIAGLNQRVVCPAHRQQWRGAAGQAVAGFAQRIGIGYIGFDIQNRGAIQKIDPGNMQAAGLHPIQLHHRLTDGVGPVGRAAGEHADTPVTAEAWWAYPQVLGT